MALDWINEEVLDQATGFCSSATLAGRLLRHAGTRHERDVRMRQRCKHPLDLNVTLRRIVGVFFF